jgi:hypothetical protein
MKAIKISLLCCLFALLFDSPTNAQNGRSVWSTSKAKKWYREQPWLVGCNFISSSAINQLEMWQQASFDTATINRELTWASNIGMNTVRVFLHDLLWQDDSTGFLKRVNIFLDIASRHHIKPMLVLFDACWDPFPKLGVQRSPKPFVHNSGWVQSPGYFALIDSAQYPRLKNYVVGVVKRFGKDKRILAWDVWNEPDNTNNSSYGTVELPDKERYVVPLLGKAFTWARSVGPVQPLTSGIWRGDWSGQQNLTALQKLQLSQSDIISFHNYDNAKEFEKRVNWLIRYDRPLLCTEYMARGNGSYFEEILPLCKKYSIAAYNWGLVDGKTQTKYPWDSWKKQYSAEPDIWFHEIFYRDGQPYKKEEIVLIKELTSWHK